MKIIAYNNSKGTCSLVYSASKEMKRLGMTEEDFLQHVRVKNKIDKIPFIYINRENLPDKKYRNAWVVNYQTQTIDIDNNKKIEIDAKILAEEELINQKQKEFEDLVELKKNQLLNN